MVASTAVADSPLQAGAAEIRLNEVLPAPKERFSSEWVELVNSGMTPVELSGWQIDDGTGGSTPYGLAAGVVLASQQVLLVELDRALFNNSGDDVRLIDAQGRTIDAFSYTGAVNDRSYCRDALGEWHAACEPSPGAANPVAAVASVAVNQPADSGVELMPDSLQMQAATTLPMASVPRPAAVWRDRGPAAIPYMAPTGGVPYRYQTPAPPQKSATVAVVPTAPAALSLEGGTERSGAGRGLWIGLALAGGGGGGLYWIWRQSSVRASDLDAEPKAADGERVL